MKKFILRIVACLMMAVMIGTCMGNAGTVFADDLEVAYSGSKKMTGNSSWWNQQQLAQAELIGDTDPADVVSIKFYSDNAFTLGYNYPGGTEWKQIDKVKEYTAEDVDFGGNYFFAIVLNENADYEATIKWDVYVKATTSTPVEEPKATATPAPTATPVPTKAPVATSGDSFDITTTKDSWGAHTTTIPVEEFEDYKDGVKITVEFNQEVADYWNLALQSDSAAGWQNINSYITSHTSNDWGYIDSFSQGDTKITVELSAKGVEKILSDGIGLLFQTYALDVTKATLSPVVAKPTATPTPTATPVPTKAPEVTDKPVATPVPTKAPEYTTVGDELLVTKEMVKDDGTVVIQDAEYNNVIIPRGIDADKVMLINVKVGELEVESGAEYKISIRNGIVGAVNVTEPKISGISKNALLQLINEKVVLTEEILLDFLANRNMMNTVAKYQPEIQTYGTTTVGKVTVSGNVKLSANGCEVSGVAIDAKNAYEELNVELNGYAGAVDVAIDRADADGYCLVKLALNNSDIINVTVSGTDGSCYISGNSAVDKVQLSNAGTVTVAVDAKEVAVDKNTEAAKVRIYGEVGTVNVAGKKNDIVLASAAKITTANVTGDSIRVYGYGKLETAEVTGAEANVAVPGTLVNGENDETIPAAMKEMSPWKNLVSKKNSSSEEAEPEGGAGDEEPVLVDHEYVVEFDAAYAGNYGVDGYIQEADVKDFVGDVEVTVYYTIEGTPQYPQFTWALVNAPKDGDNWVNVSKAHYTTSNYISEAGWVLVSDDATSLTYTLAEAGIAEIVNQTEAEDKIAVQISGIIVSKIVINGQKWGTASEGENDGGDEEPEPTNVVLYTGNFDANNWGSSESIGAEALSALKLDGTEKIVVTYTASDGAQLKFADSSWNTILMAQLSASATTREIILTEELGAALSAGFAIQGAGFVITEIKVVDRADAENTNVYSGSQDSGSWSGNVDIGADKLNGLAFDGSEKLLITYKTTDATGNTYTTIQLSDSSWTAISSANVDVASCENVYEVILTSEYAVFAEGGVHIQGYNWTITDVTISVEE